MVEVKIDKLGRQGDGICTVSGSEVFVPYTLPEEVVEISGSGARRTAEKIVSTSDLRTEPFCKHFGSCGGCHLQHYEDEAYREWKHDLAVEPLCRAGITLQTDTLVCFPAASRRKVVFSANRKDGRLHLGFSKRGSNELVDVEECPVLLPELSSSLAGLRNFAQSLPLGARPVRLSVLSTTTGIDLEVEGPLKLASPQRNGLCQKATELGFARLSLNGEVLIEPRRPLLKMGLAQVTPPPGGFVQAVFEAETAMAELVCGHLEGCKSVVDLYCGTGTFALRLAERSTVWAVEESASAIAALERAWRETGGKLKQIKAETRNLERRPVSFQELKKIEGLVFDPPRAGAEIQAKQIAKSRVKKIAAVSCNPTTLARDLTILIDGGYRITRIVPIDQFRFTPHVEVVVLLER